MYDTTWDNVRPAQEATEHSLSERVFAGLIGLFIVAGLAALAAGVTIATTREQPLLWALPALVVMLVAFEATHRTDNWRLSLPLHLLSSFAAGVLSAPVLSLPGAGTLRLALVMFVIGAVVLTIGAFLHPYVVRRFGVFAIGTLAATAGAWLLVPHIPAAWPLPPLGVVPIALAAASLAFLDYYWSNAFGARREIDAAVDTATALYLDPLNRAVALIDRVANRHNGHSPLDQIPR
jgi:hypothetical protein